MTEAEIAKNILLNHVCDNCIHSDNEFFLECDIRKNFPEERTCAKWKFLPPLDLKMNTYFVNTKPRKLNVR